MSRPAPDATPGDPPVVAIPMLRTRRLVLRAPGPEDFEPYAAFCASERAAAVGGPHDRAEAWTRLCALIGHWRLRGFGRWIVVEDGAPMGIVGLLFPEGWPEPEIAWTLFRAAEGRGIAFEAALAAREHAYHALGWRTAVSLAAADNARSAALARRLGARRDGHWEHPSAGTLDVWRHPGPAASGAEAGVEGAAP